MKTIASRQSENLEPWRRSDRWQTKKNQFNYDDVLAELNVQHRASWFDTQTDYAAPHLPRGSISCVFLLPPFLFFSSFSLLVLLETELQHSWLRVYVVQIRKCWFESSVLRSHLLLFPVGRKHMLCLCVCVCVNESKRERESKCVCKRERKERRNRVKEKTWDSEWKRTKQREKVSGREKRKMRDTHTCITKKNVLAISPIFHPTSHHVL